MTSFFRHSALALLLIAATGLPAAPALAGPNEEGSLILHIEPDLVYTTTSSRNWCDYSTLRDCTQANVYAPGDDQVVVIFLMAAFPLYDSPRVKGLQFGIDYTCPAPISSGHCGEDVVEVSDFSWPAPFTGTAIAYDSVVTDRLFVVYWFATYAYDGTTFSVIDHPGQGEASFGNDTIPVIQDRVEGFGKVGFGVAGENPCLEGVSLGACCLQTGACTVTTLGACDVQDGTYLGDDTVCDTFSCTGACCVDQDCFADMTVTECEREGGDFQGPGTTCRQISCIRRETSWGKIKEAFRGY